MTCARLDDVGSYLLGGLDEDERERFAAHLPGCAACRRELEELQSVADTLPLAAPQIVPPPELKDRIMAVVHADVARREAEAAQAAQPAQAEPPATPEPARPARPQRPRPWWRRPRLALRPVPAALAAAALIALGVAGGVLVSGGDEAARTVTALVDAPSAPGARATVAVADEHATLTVRDFPAPPEGRVYQVWLKRPGRDPEPTGALFTPRGGRAVVEVRDGVGGVEQVLVTDEPRGGSRVPTRAPVVVARRT
jgi:anti-sigma factor RsiW